MNKFKHVCFSDLDNYFRRDTYFSDLSESEKQIILENLNVPTIESITKTSVTKGSYAEIKELADTKSLLIQNKYIITDFQSIYESNSGEVWGPDNSKYPSKKYNVILTPTSNSTFDTRVSLMFENLPLPWEVCYDFTQKKLSNGTLTKGKITYLKDQNNNSAYYDFKNYRFYISLKNSEIPGLSYDVSLAMYTFSKLEGLSCKDNSEDVGVFNNHFDEDCWVNIFLGNTNNNQFFGGFKNNIFVKGCEYNKFEWNTSNNKFLEKVSYTQGSVQNAIVSNTNYDSSISKEFRMLSTSTSSEPVFVVTFLDGDTLSNQIIKLNSTK